MPQLVPDIIPTEVGLPVAIVLCLVWLWLEVREARGSKR